MTSINLRIYKSVGPWILPINELTQENHGLHPGLTQVPLRLLKKPLRPKFPPTRSPKIRRRRALSMRTMRWMHLDGYGGRILNCVTWTMWCLFFVRQSMVTSGWYMWSNVVCENSVQRNFRQAESDRATYRGKRKAMPLPLSWYPGWHVIPCHKPRGHQFWCHTTRTPEPIPQAPAVKLRQDRISSGWRGWILAILGALMCLSFNRSILTEYPLVTWPHWPML